MADININSSKKELVAQKIKSEYTKCIKDPMYFMKKYVKIQNPIKGTVNFDLYDFQEEALQKIVDNRFTIILKARQMGISTLVAAYSLYLMTFFKDKNILVISITQETAKEIVTRVRYAYSNLPAWIKPKTEVDNRLSLRLENGSQIKAASASASTGRSSALSFLIIDECVEGNSIITVRNKKTDKIENIKIKDFYNIFENSLYEVLTPKGWSNFDNIRKTSKREYCYVKFTDNTEIKCSTSHKFKLKNGKFKYAAQLDKGYEIIGKDDNKIIDSVEIIDGEIELYDLINVKKNHEYYINDLISSNCAFIDGIASIWTSAQPTLSTGGKACLLSSPNGISNFFHKTWVGAESHMNNFIPIKLPWYLHPDRDQKWRDAQTELLGKKQAAQENDCEFMTTGDQCIPLTILEKYKTTEIMVMDPKERRGPINEFWIWERPLSTKNYMISADCSRGDGSDYSAFHVFDLKTMEQVAEYKGKITTKEYGNILVAVATEYNDAILVIENNNVGWATIQQVIDRGYKNLFYGSNRLNVVDIEKSFASSWTEDDNRLVAGFTTTNVNRQLIINNMIVLVQNFEIKIHSARLISELSTFIWKDGKPQAMKGYNDDLIMSFGIGLWVRNTALRMKIEQYNVNQSMLNSIRTTHLPINSFSDSNQYLSNSGNQLESNNRLFDKNNAIASWYIPTVSDANIYKSNAINQLNTVFGRNIHNDDKFDLKELLY